jgi:hypothetical protein
MDGALDGRAGIGSRGEVCSSFDVFGSAGEEFLFTNEGDDTDVPYRGATVSVGWAGVAGGVSNGGIALREVE